MNMQMRYFLTAVAARVDYDAKTIAATLLESKLLGKN